MKKLLTFILISLLFICTYAQRDFSSIQIKTHKVADQLYYLEGSGGNIGVHVGEDGILMIDSQFAPLSEKIRKAIADIDDGEIKFLVDTHLHGDHIGGNANFSATGSIIVAHENVRKRISVEQVNTLRGTTTPPVEKDALPVVTFSKDMSFHFNGEEMRVYHGPPAHTDGDAVIYFVNANAIHCGDVFVRYGFPFIDVGSGGSIEGFIGFVDDILEMINDETKVIPGHGALGTKADVKQFRDRLATLYYGIKSQMAQGKSLEDIQASDLTAPYDDEWGKGFIKGKDFIALMYHSLAK